MPIWILLLWSALTQDSLNSRDAYLAAARAYIAQGNFLKAAEILDPVLDADPDAGSESYLTLMECRLKLDQKEGALEAAERGIKRYPTSGPLLKAAGAMILQERPTSERAGELLERATKAMPQDPGAQYAYGLWALLNHQEEIAVAAERRALALSPADDLLKVQAQTFIGVGEDALKRPQRAEAAFRAALAVNRKLPNPNPSAALEFAMFLTRQSRQGEAQELIDEILKFAPGFGPAHLERAKYLSVQGNLESALAESKAALDQAGSDLKSLRAAHAFLAWTCFALGRMDEAEVHQRWIESH
jgi:tetratricopeptide (TPR) repeat protein